MDLDQIITTLPEDTVRLKVLDDKFLIGYVDQRPCGDWEVEYMHFGQCIDQTVKPTMREALVWLSNQGTFDEIIAMDKLEDKKKKGKHQPSAPSMTTEYRGKGRRRM